MPAFQFYNPAPVFFDLLGLAPIDGGSLTFYDLGTTTPRDTWSDPAMGVPDLNPNPVELDAAGRAESPIFLDGEYTVVCKDSLGATIWTRDVIPGGDSALTIPALETGEFLSNDGVNLLWQTIRQMPDATGSTGQVPTSNGAGGYTLQDLPDFTPPDPEITVDEVGKEFIAGVSTDDTKFVTLAGDSTAPASGGRETSKAIVFDTAFDTLQHVSITITGDGLTAFNDCPRLQITSQSVTGFTVRFNTGENSTASGWNITSDVPFSWMAFGTREIPA